MAPPRVRFVVVLTSLMLAPLGSLSLCAQPSGKPLLSEEARRIVEEEGVAAAQQRLGTVAMMGRDTYEMDVEGMVALGREYVNAGKVDAALAVLHVAALLDMNAAEPQAALGDAYLAQGIPQAAVMHYQAALENDPEHVGARERLLAMGDELPPGREEREAEAARRQGAEAAARTGAASRHRGLSDGQLVERRLADRERGPKRDDVDRFKGRYADPKRAVEHWVFWVSETCLGSGYLMAGAEWGDVAPWQLWSESESVFREASLHGEVPIRFHFELGPEGPARSLTMRGGPLDGTRLDRLGDLAEGWQPEGEDCYYR